MFGGSPLGYFAFCLFGIVVSCLRILFSEALTGQPSVASGESQPQLAKT